MKRSTFFFPGLVLLASLSTPLLAQTPDAMHATGSLDNTHDGAIDRAEAAKRPWLAAHFDALDRNHDGRLEASERPQRMGRHHDRHRGMERMDADHDGRLSRSEFDAAKAARAARRSGRDDVDSRRRAPDFTAIDRNHDGYIVASEVRAYHERMRPQREVARRARLDHRYSSADLNHDGKLDRVEVSERLPRLGAHFAWLDENRDGFLSRAELQMAHERR